MVDLSLKWWAVVLLVLCAACVAEPNGSGDLLQLVNDGLSDGKRRLAQNLLTNELRNRESVSVEHAFTWKLGTIQGSATSTFRSFNQSFILVGKVLHRLVESSGSSNFSTVPVAQFEEFLGDIAFVESVEWDGLLYLLAAYKQGLLQLFTVSPDNNVTLRQSLKSHGIPTDAEFFMQDEALFLVVTAQNGSALVPIVVYQWLGTQLDQLDRKLEIGATAVSTFPFRGSVIIVAATGAGSQKTGLVVFSFSGKRFQLVDVKFMSEPSALQHFHFRDENYLLVTSAHGPNIIYWWDGTQMIVFGALETDGILRSIGVGYIRGETLLLLAEQAKIKIYRPTATGLQLVDTQEFNTAVKSATLYTWGETISLLVITETAGALVPHILELRLVFQPASIGHRVLVRDPLLQCFSSLDDGIRGRAHMLKDIIEQRSHLLHKASPGQFTGKLVVKKLVPQNADILSHTVVGPIPKMTAVDIRNKAVSMINAAQSLQASLKNVVLKSSPSTLSGRLVADNLRIVDAKLESVIISIMNGQRFDPKNLLMHSKEQKLSGKLFADTISTDTLLVGSLNNIQIDDLLKREGNQVVAALEVVTSVQADKVIINSNSAINNIVLKRIATTKSSGDTISVTGSKTFSGLNLQQLAVDILNDVSFNAWINSLQPATSPVPPVPAPPTTSNGRAQNFIHGGNLSIQNLTVEGSIDGIPFNDLLNSLFLKGRNQKIIGDLRYIGKVKAKNLHATLVNGVPSSSLLTRSTDQTISNLNVDSLSAPDLYTPSVNGLQMSRDVAYIGSPFSVSTPVSFERLQSHELILPPKATIAGQPIGSRLLNQPKIVYEGRVKVKGTLKLTDVNLQNATVSLGGDVVDFKNIMVHYWTKNTEQVIPHSIVAPHGLNVKSLTLTTINGVGFEKFVDVSKTKTLQGTWHIPVATIYGNLEHEYAASQFPVNLKNLASITVKTSGDYTISGKKEFRGGFTTKQLITEYLDSKKVSDLFDGKISQGVSSFEEIWVGGDLIIRSNLFVGSVNKLNLCHRLSKALLTDGPGHIPAAVISAVSAANINVKTFNRVPFSVLASGRNETTMPRVRKITLKGDVHIPAFINVMRLNNKSPTPDYVSKVVDRTMSGVIRGKKTFASHLTVKGDFDAGDFNGANLKDLFDNALSKTRDQTISAQIWMKEMIAEDGLTAVQINNVDVENLLSSDLMSRQTVEGDLIFYDGVDVLGHLSAGSFGKGCDLSKVAHRLRVLDARNWSSLTVEGNLDWTEPLKFPSFGLGYYLNSSVTKNDEQYISGEISFESPVRVNNFKSVRDINDIAISAILTDSLKKSLPDQVIRSQKVFTHKLHSTSMKVMGNVVARNVAGVNIALFNRSLVRVDGNQDVGGKKDFLQGFSANHLKVNGAVNGLVTSSIVNYDMPRLPPIHFVRPVVISGNLHFERANDLSLDELLLNRVTLDSRQDLESKITFTRDLTIAGNMIAPTINNLDIGHLVLRDSTTEQVIEGLKRFVQTLRVEGPMEVDYLETIDLRRAYAAALFTDENATLTGNLIFNNMVSLEADLDVADTVNSITMADLARMLRSFNLRDFAQVYSIARTIKDTNILLKARGDLSQMLYLEPVLDLPLSFTDTHRVIAMNVGGNETYLDVHGWASNKVCGLPAACACPGQYSVHVSSEGPAQVSWNTGLGPNKSERSFTFHLNNPQVTVMVKTNTVSSSNRCRLEHVERLNEVTMLTWVELDHTRKFNEVLKETTLHIEPTPILGYISDVKAITFDNRIYLVLGIAYNADLDTTDINSIIVRIDTKSQKARIVTEFLTHGVSTLDVFYTNRGPHLVVGNSFDTATGSSQVFLDVYRFNTRSEQLQLVKSIPAESIVSAVSIVQGGDNLIIVGQKQLYAPVMVLKYDSAHDDYHFLQQLNPNTIPTGLGVFYIGQPGQSDAYLGVSTEDDQFHLYKFCHVEGFKLVMKMELKGVKGFSTFFVGAKQYLIFSSSETPSVFEIVKQSS